MSTISKGNYYKKRTKEYYEKLGYTTQLTEFTCGTFVNGRCFYRKVDVFGSDGISMNGKEIIFWNSKHCTTNDKNNINTQIREAKKEFLKFPFPDFIKLEIVMWEPRKKPKIYILNNKAP